MATEIETKGWWGRGLTAYNYEYGTFAVNDGLISFTRNPKFKPKFIFPVTDITRVQFGNQRQMMLYTNHGKYVCYWYLPSQQVMAFEPHNDVQFDMFSIRGWKDMVDYNEKFCVQWEEVLRAHNVPVKYVRRVNPAVIGLLAVPFVAAIIAWWVFKDGLNP